MTDPEPRPYVPSGPLMSHVVDPITLSPRRPHAHRRGAGERQADEHPRSTIRVRGRPFFRAVEVPRSFFTAVPDPEDHAVFRIDPVAPAGQGQD